ncbi:hypothetical protein HPB47_024774 [Ixodes persulcatus]|uniref:Uncharacterized protein n=1 Tax=Ixodes persulcatus TaxID=34615 RepID=A0AC60Q3D4_IXOPE|nr:hypothetical protein HPB47_024774 [Ixodes persulcatus]
MRHFSPSGPAAATPAASQIRRPAFFSPGYRTPLASAGVHCVGRCLERSLRPRAPPLLAAARGEGDPHEGAAAGHAASLLTGLFDDTVAATTR